MTKRTNKLLSLLLSVIMALSCFAGLAVNAGADAIDDSVITFDDVRTSFTPIWGTANCFPKFDSEKFSVSEAEWLSVSTYKKVSTLSKDTEYVLRLKLTAAGGYKFDETMKASYIGALEIEGIKSTIVSVVTAEAFEVWFTVKIPKSIKFTAYFEANGGDGKMAEVNVEINSTYTIPTCKFTAPKGQKFDCWLVITEDGAAIMNPGSSIKMTQNVFLIAQWTTGSSSGTTYTVKNLIIDATAKDAGGKVYFSVKEAENGERVVAEVVADKGFELDTLDIVDENGNTVSTFALGDNRFSFTMPGLSVFVSAEFKEADDTCPKDKTCPLYKFSDLVIDGWYHDGIHYCIEKKLMQGKSETRFDPNGDMTRAQIVTVLWRYAGSPAVKYGINYSDVKDGDWYIESVRWATALGIITGNENGEFRPNVGMTREQLALVLYRYATAMGVDTKKTSSDISLRAFGDYAEVSVYAQPAMQWVCDTGIMTGSANKLRPDTVATRAQTAAMIVRFCETTTK